MKVVRLQAEGFKRLVTVEITPDGNVVKIGGKNGSGKSSVLDAIYVALKGRAVGPPKPIRTGEEKALIKVDLGELIVTRTFTAKEGGTFTDSLKVENADGLRYGSPQGVLDALLGEIGFDPFEFVQMKPDKQAETLLTMVPLAIDLDEFAELDTSDYAKRRDINRDAAQLKGQIAGYAKGDPPEKLPDRQALLDTMGNASNHNTEIAVEQNRRSDQTFKIETWRRNAVQYREQAEDLRRRAELAEAEAKREENQADEAAKALEGLQPLAEPIDTDAIREQLKLADEELRIAGEQQARKGYEAALAKLEADSAKLTEAMEAREKERQDALAGAEMPIEGLAFGLNEKGKPVVTFGGVPFEQASSAEQLRASTAIAMRANPQLRVLRVKDGSLLDEDGMKLLAEMAAAEDFQLWVEVVGTGGVGVIMENGLVKAEPTVAEEGTAGGTVEDRKPAKVEQKAKAKSETLL